MPKIVYTSLAEDKRIKSRVATKRLKGPDGLIIPVSILNADVDSFADDLAHVFRKNVRKARRANKKLGPAQHAHSE